MVVTDAVDVIEDQRHPLSHPRLVLSAELADRAFQAGVVQTLLEMSPVV